MIVQKMLPMKIGGPYSGKRGDFSLQTTSYACGPELGDWMYSGESSLHIPRKKRKLFKEELQ